jgi:hypothetical protein
LSNKPHVDKENESLHEICLCIWKPKGHDPHSIVYDHIKSVKLTHLVIHEVNFVENLFKEAFCFEEVIQNLQDDSTRERLQKKKMKKGAQ